MTPLRRDPKSLTVLVLEDDALQRRFLVSMLRRIGVGQVLEAADGRAAIDVVSTEARAVDVALCDLRMEGMDGVEFIRQAARLRVRSFAIVSAVEDDVLASVERMATACGATMLGRMQKPVQEATLADLLLSPANARQGGPRAANAAPALDEIRLGLAQGEFEAFFQPKVCIRTGRIAGAEALARWRHPARGLLPPALFVEPLERAGLLDPLTDNMLTDALAFQARCAAAGLDLGVAINASPSCMQDTGFAGRLLALAAGSGVSTSKVTIEVTETAMAGDAPAMLETISRLRIHGFRVSIDDFGTGYATMQRLHHLPVTELKIDRSFVRGAARDSRKRALLGSMIRLARDLELQTVAEGVETSEEQALLSDLGCDLAQGFLHAKPMAPSDFLAWALGRDGLMTAAA